MNKHFNRQEEKDTGKNLGKAAAVQKSYLLDPMFIGVAINLNTCYVPNYQPEPFKYNVTVLVSNVVANINPEMLKQVVGASIYAQMFSFREQLQKFRPRIRIQAFIEKRRNEGKLTVIE